MKPLIVLFVAFGMSLLVTWLVTGSADVSLSGRIAMSAMLLFTAIGHFAYTKGMVLMMPDFIPYKKELVYLTGLIEVAAAIGLLVPQLQRTTAWLLLLFFLLILPANIHAALRRVDYQAGTYSGPGTDYLWFRVPLQLFFMVWVYWFAVHL